MPIQEEKKEVTRHQPTFPELFNFTGEPFVALTRMRHAMDSMFNDLFQNWRQEPGSTTVWSPSMDMYQEGENLVVECALPGLKKEEIEIHATADSLTIKGEYKKTEKHKVEGHYTSELRTGKYWRQIALPTSVKSEAIKAELTNGLLKVTLPMAEPMRHKTTRVSIT